MHKTPEAMLRGLNFFLDFHDNRQNHGTSLCFLPDIIFQGIFDDTFDIIPAGDALRFTFLQQPKQRTQSIAHW